MARASAALAWLIEPPDMEPEVSITKIASRGTVASPESSGVALGGITMTSR